MGAHGILLRLDVSRVGEARLRDADDAPGVDVVTERLSVAIAGPELSQPNAATTTLLIGLGFQCVLLVPTLLAFSIDARFIDGSSVWSKPLKFELSTIITILTALVCLRFLSPEQTKSHRLRASASAITICSAAEVAYICLQAGRGVRSHFNYAEFGGLGYILMGVGAVGIVAGCFGIGAVMLRAPASPGSDGLRLGGAFGLILGAVMTLITAGILSSGLFGSGHWVGGVQSDAHGLPLVGWSTTGGDLRVPHFFATHLMQALPLLGWMADRARTHQPGRVIAAGGAAGVLLILAVLWQALAGRPFWG
jgi:hypothetical protein